MQTTFVESLRKKAMSLSDVPATLRVPGCGDNPGNRSLVIEDASIDDLAFAIQGLESEISLICRQLNALQKLHDLARARGAIGTDRIGVIFGGED